MKHALKWQSNNFKESYTSKTIHNEIGLGYLICHDCYGEELKGEKTDE